MVDKSPWNFVSHTGLQQTRAVLGTGYIVPSAFAFVFFVFFCLLTLFNAILFSLFSDDQRGGRVGRRSERVEALRLSMDKIKVFG
jgi:hypothetical protein